MMRRRRGGNHQNDSLPWRKAYKILEIFCCPPCSPCIISKLAFHPPKPPSYYVVPYKDNHKSKGQEQMRMLLADRPNLEVRESVVFVSIANFPCKKQRIALVKWALPKPSEFLILHSHVNGEDLGGLYDYMTLLRDETKCEIVSYDYCGYGASSGAPSEVNARKAGLAAIKYIMNTLNQPVNKIILHGQSIGSVPTAYLASIYDVAGVIFHSGLFSGLRLILHHKRNKALFSCIDPFRNVDFIPKIRAPVLFIHGTRDRVIPVSHAMDLYKICKTAVHPLWMEGAGHMGLETRTEFINRLKEFLHFVKHRQRALHIRGSVTKRSRLLSKKVNFDLKATRTTNIKF